MNATDSARATRRAHPAYESGERTILPSFHALRGTGEQTMGMIPRRFASWMYFLRYQP